MLTTATLGKIALELTLGVCMKLFCDNGRIHYKDFVNDFLFWLPGVDVEDSDGLSRQVRALHVNESIPSVEAPSKTALAAK